MALRSSAVLLAAAVFTLLAPARAVIGSDFCNQYWQVDWIVATQGPIFMCGGKPGNSTVVFKWSGTEDHGVFQIPTDACPEGGFGGFATDSFKELAATAPSGEFAWQLPTEPGDYWVTSQAGQDCINGMKAQIRVMEADTPVKNAAAATQPRQAAAVAAAAAGLALLAALGL